MPSPQKWGVTVDEVSALAPHITIKATSTEPLTADPVFGATQPRAILREQVDGFITDVAARVAIRTVKMASITDEATKDLIERAAHDLVVNGAGAYLVAAAFPAKAGLNDQSSLSAELWNRFTTGLDALVGTIDVLTAPGAVIPGDASPGVTEGFFQDPLIPDVPQVTGYRDCPIPGSWSW